MTGDQIQQAWIDGYADGFEDGKGAVLRTLRAEAERDDIHVDSAQLLKRIIRTIEGA